MRFSQCKAPALETRPKHHMYTLFGKYVGSLTSPVNHVTLKMQETRPYSHSLTCGS